MSEMDPIESFERVREGLARATSCARQLGKAQRSKAWLSLADSLEAMGVTAQKLYESKPLGRQEVLAMIDHLVNEKIINEGSGKVQ